MEKIILKNYKNNLDCIELWNYILVNKPNMSDLKEKFSNENWKEERAYNSKFCSNLVYCLQKLRKIGAINMVGKRSSDGEYDYSIIETVKEPVLSKVESLICINCGNDVIKSKSSVYVNLCTDCTNKTYVQRVIKIDESKIVKREDLVRKRSYGKCIYCESDAVNNSNRLCKSNSCIARHYALMDSNLGSGASALNVIKKRIIGDFCCVCGYDKTLNYHHVVEKCDGGSDLLTNIIPLCPNHHAEVHYCGLDVTNYHNKVLKRIEDIKNGLIIIE